MLPKQAELDLIAGDVKESGFGLEDLLEDGVGELRYSRTRYVYERERGRQEGNRHLRRIDSRHDPAGRESDEEEEVKEEEWERNSKEYLRI